MMMTSHILRLMTPIIVVSAQLLLKTLAGEVALNWCICKGTVPIPGARTLEQVLWGHTAVRQVTGQSWPEFLKRVHADESNSKVLQVKLFINVLLTSNNRNR